MRECTVMKPPFFYLNLPLILAGFDIEQDEDPNERRSRSIRRCCLVSVNLITQLYEFSDLIFGPGFIAVLCRSTPRLLQIFIQMNVLWHLHEIEKLIRKLCQKVDGRTFCLLKFFSLIWFVSRLSSDLIHLNLDGPWTEISFITSFIQTIYFALTDIFMTSIPLQMFTLLLLYHRQKKNVALLYRAARKGRDEIMFDVAQDMVKNQQRFEKLFSLHPTAWLTYNFSLTTMSLSLLNFDELRSLLLQMHCNQFFAALPMLLMVWFQEQFTQHQSCLVFVYAMASPSGHREMSPALSGLLDQALSSNFTVWGLLRINRALVFSFISTVLTFSVLALQIASGSLVVTDQCNCQTESWEQDL